jgi:HlyD family type I secretion membrane fusion protein
MADGVVVAEGDRSTVRHLEGGIVKVILIREGEAVSAGQVLVRLDDVQASARLRSLQSDYDDTRAQIARLTAEWGGSEDVLFPPDLLARREVPRIEAIVTGEQRQFADRRAALEASLAIIAQRRGLYESHIDGLRLQIESNQQQLALLADEIGGLEGLFAQGYVPKNRLLSLKREAARLRGQIGEYQATIAQAEVKITEAEAERIEMETGHRKEITAELRQLQAKQAELEESMTAARDSLRRLDIIAPRSGTVFDLKVHAQGAVLLPGDAVLDLVPAGETILVDAQIRPTDIDNIKVGDQAEVRFPAFRQRTTPSVYADVITVGADTLIHPETGAAYYTARLTVRADEKARLGDLPLITGMTASVSIRTGERTIIEYMTEPLTDVIARSFPE